MNSIFTYFDFREYIRDAVKSKRKKNPRYSFRCAANRIGIPSGTLTRILNGSRHVGSELLPKLIAYLGLKRREAEYFSLLVAFESIKDENRRRQCYRDLLKMRSERSAVVPEEKHQFFEKWYHSALFELMRIVKKGDDPARLSSLFIPPLSESKARKALEVLQRLGYIKQDPEKGTFSTEPFLTTGDTWESVAIHAFQVAVSDLAVQALDTIPKEERDFSTLTMALSPEAFEKVREVVKNARADIAAIERACSDPKRVYQINFQCFPLTKRPGGEKEEDRND